MRPSLVNQTTSIERLKYNVLRFSLDSVDLNVIEAGTAISVQVRPSSSLDMHLSDRSTEQVAPVRFCMCNLHSLVSNENFTLKVGNIQIRQLLRLYPDSWLEAGSIHVPELRINAKLDCHTSKPTHLNEQMQYLRRHDQALPRLHFLYQTRSHQSIAHPSSGNTRFACACLGGSPVYFTLVTGEEFFRTSFRLGEQSSFGRSLFRPDLHVVHSHPVFQQKYSWPTYQTTDTIGEPLQDEEIFYPFDFCAQDKPPSEKDFPRTIRSDSQAFTRTTSEKYPKGPSLVDHKRSLSSVSFRATGPPSSVALSTDDYSTPNQPLSESSSSSSSTASRKSSQTSLNSAFDDLLETPVIMASQPPINPFAEVTMEEDRDDLSSSSSSTDSLTALEEILQRQQLRNSAKLFTEQVSSALTFMLNGDSSVLSLLNLGYFIIGRQPTFGDLVIASEFVMDQLTPSNDHADSEVHSPVHDLHSLPLALPFVNLVDGAVVSSPDPRRSNRSSSTARLPLRVTGFLVLLPIGIDQRPIGCLQSLPFELLEYHLVRERNLLEIHRCPEHSPHATDARMLDHVHRPMENLRATCHVHPR